MGSVAVRPRASAGPLTPFNDWRSDEFLSGRIAVETERDRQGLAVSVEVAEACDDPRLTVAVELVPYGKHPFREPELRLPIRKENGQSARRHGSFLSAPPGAMAQALSLRRRSYWDFSLARSRRETRERRSFGLPFPGLERRRPCSGV